MFCENCGKEVKENAIVCLNCGVFIKEKKMPVIKASDINVSKDDKRSGAWAFLCCMFPLVGLILYIVWNETMPLRAKSCGKGAIIGMIIEVAIIIIAAVLIIFVSVITVNTLNNPNYVYN